MRSHPKPAILIGAAMLALAACGGSKAPASAPTTAEATTPTTADPVAISKAYAYYVSSVQTQNLGRPATLAEATPLIEASCQLLATTTPASAFRTIAQGAQSGSNVTLNAGVQDVILATSAAKFVCPAYLAAVEQYLASVSG